VDQFAVQKEYWALDSNNNFENSIVAAVRSHFTATSSAGTPLARVSSGILWAKSQGKTWERAPSFSD
jgi:hypothetical protein